MDDLRPLFDDDFIKEWFLDEFYYNSTESINEKILVLKYEIDQEENYIQANPDSEYAPKALEARKRILRWLEEGY